MFMNGFFRLKERNYAGGATTSGLTSSLAFTPVQVKQNISIQFSSKVSQLSCCIDFRHSIIVQGIELCNPQQALGLGSGTQSTYFSESGTFSKLKKI